MSDATRGGSAAGGSERSDTVRLDRDGEPVDGGQERGEDANDVEADNAVEEDTIETVDPDNAPA